MNVNSTLFNGNTNTTLLQQILENMGKDTKESEESLISQNQMLAALIYQNQERLAMIKLSKEVKNIVSTVNIKPTTTAPVQEQNIVPRTYSKTTGYTVVTKRRMNTLSKIYFDMFNEVELREVRHMIKGYGPKLPPFEWCKHLSEKAIQSVYYKLLAIKNGM